MYTEKDIRRFYGHVAIGKPEECWEWHGTRNAQGYGQFCFGGNK